MYYTNHLRAFAFVFALLLCVASLGGSVALLEIAALDTPSARILNADTALVARLA